MIPLSERMRNTRGIREMDDQKMNENTIIQFLITTCCHKEQCEQASKYLSRKSYERITY
jgi:hypothetical protein